MAKKRRVDPATSSTGVSNEESVSPKGLSKEAWIAIGTIAAALITGGVAVLTHVLPKAPSNPPTVSSSPANVSSNPSTVSSSPPVATPSSAQVTTADTIAGKWAGTAKDSNDTVFQITLEVRKSCGLNERCGVISVSHVPCYGEVFLEKAQGAEFEFRVANFYGQSNRKVCQPGAGEHFRLKSDGKLAYTTSYEPNTQGVLDRIGD